MNASGGILNRLVFVAAMILALATIAPQARAQTVEVRGSSRVDAETIRNYFTGGDPAKVNQAVKELYATGLFSSVRTERVGGRIIVSVVENTPINRVFFEGNSKVKSEQLSTEVQLRSRGAYNPATVQADMERIRDLYRRGGRSDATVTSRTVDLPNGKVDVVFTIDEGSKTGVVAINFVGNQVYSGYRLRNLIQTTEMNFLSFLKSSDVYDPDQIAKDEELIRAFYLHYGYADFRIVGSDAHYDPAQKGYIITVTLDEGQQYHVGSVAVESQLPNINTESLRAAVKVQPGDVYDAVAVTRSVDAITREVGRSGYAFASAKPRGDRDPATATVTLAFVVEEGPRAYIERIDIHGNTRTRDYVIRREFPLGEGDAYNKALIDLGERRLNSLGYFKKVKVNTVQGGAPDKVIIDVDVEDQSTGSFSVSGGYSSTDGLIAEVSVSESNFLGRGQYTKLSVTGGSRTRGIEFSFTEPYFLDYRLAAGFDVFSKFSKNNRYSIYDSTSTGITLRLGIPITDFVSITPRYSIYRTTISIPNTASRPYNDCNVPINGVTPGTDAYNTANATNSAATAINPINGMPYGFPNPTYNCLSNGEASLAIKESAGTRITSLAGYSLIYSTLDNPRNPYSGIYAEFRQDFAGLGGQSHFMRTTTDLRYYYPVYDDIVAFAKVQGGDIRALGGHELFQTDNFNLGPSLVRGFAPNGIGPRDVSTLTSTCISAICTSSLGGTEYIGGTLETQFPIYGLPKDIGLRGALFADAGTLFGYHGRTNFSEFLGLPANSPCVPALVFPTYTQSNCISPRSTQKIRSSVGASILWASPLGPIRFDYAFVLSKDKFDIGQAFRFSGGGTF